MEVNTVWWRTGSLRLKVASGSVVGNRYAENYDVLHVDSERPLAVVADGMGSGEGSATAGRTAVDVFTQTAAPGALREAVANVQTAVREKGRPIAGLTGCTLTAFVGDGENAWLVQLGDSRVYRLRNGLLELLTVDHTAAWLGLLHGWFTPESPEAHSARYRLFRYAGHPDKPEPDVLSIGLHRGDQFLICTDGVSDQVSYQRIQQLLEAGTDPGATVEALLNDTLIHGDDNATAVVIQCVSALPSEGKR
ncbi:PP2C family serine/threonine-protein phosphatase [Actinoplanes sp. TFC3]|uniref:PP2C family protein-serine/threonine phosphatase n=1 Tax=Actinoplanes sp. TFC3 TaxID=1710355 RepID=UPI00083742A4|nr:PP2C family serine/threonine-protein phosphatase [Actinoplanes sp. TFC3]